MYGLIRNIFCWWDLPLLALSISVLCFCIIQLTTYGSTRIEVAFLFWLVVFPRMLSVKLASFGTGQYSSRDYNTQMHHHFNILPINLSDCSYNPIATWPNNLEFQIQHRYKFLKILPVFLSYPILAMFDYFGLLKITFDLSAWIIAYAPKL